MTTASATLAASDLTRVIKALSETGFLFSATDFDERRRADDKASAEELLKKTLSWCDIATKMAVPVIEVAPGFKEAMEMFNFRPSLQAATFDESHLKNKLLTLGNGLDLVAFRYVISQPVFVGVKFADTMSKEERALIFQTFDQRVLECRDLTSSMKAGFGKVTMSVVGIFLWLFSQKQSAAHFVTTEKEKLRQAHFWRKVYSISWAVDLQSDSATKHSGLPIIVDALFNKSTFENSLKAARQVGP